MSRHGAKIVIPQEQLAHLLGFNKGIIHQVQMSDDQFDNVYILIEHTDLPERPLGSMLPLVNPELLLFTIRVSPKRGIRERIADAIDVFRLK